MQIQVKTEWFKELGISRAIQYAYIKANPSLKPQEQARALNMGERSIYYVYEELHRYGYLTRTRKEIKFYR